MYLRYARSLFPRTNSAEEHKINIKEVSLSKSSLTLQNDSEALSPFSQQPLAPEKVKILKKLEEVELETEGLISDKHHSHNEYERKIIQTSKLDNLTSE